MTEETAAVVAALLVLRQRREFEGARARFLEQIAEMRARLEQTNPERLAAVAAQTPEEHRAFVAAIEADIARLVRERRA